MLLEADPTFVQIFVQQGKRKNTKKDQQIFFYFDSRKTPNVYCKGISTWLFYLTPV